MVRDIVMLALGLFACISAPNNYAAEIISVSGAFTYAFNPLKPDNWQIYTNGVDYPLASVVNHSGNAGQNGAYIWTPRDKTPGFGSLSTSKTEFVWGCAFSNSADVVIREIDLRLAAGQWGGSKLNELNDSLALEWAKISSGAPLLNRDDLYWQSLRDPLFTAKSTENDLTYYPIIDEEQHIVISKEIAPAEILMFRFRDNATSPGGNAALGISLFEVEFKSFCGFEISIEALPE
ncbi:MAG: hypothetical protein IJQ34_00120 [Kiritimatiellae bacterium]|nr:hypothetical protein [Kiritimatiellia bacterium]